MLACLLEVFKAVRVWVWGLGVWKAGREGGGQEGREEGEKKKQMKEGGAGEEVERKERGNG